MGCVNRGLVGVLARKSESLPNQRFRNRTANNPETIRGGQLGGPVAFFDKEYEAVAILSPLNHFMVTSMVTDDTTLNFGLMGSIKVNLQQTVQLQKVSS